MTYAPSTLVQLRAYLEKMTGLDPESLGIVGDAAHIGVGTSYHLGEDQLSSTAYSVAESPRDRDGLTGAASALDVGMFPRLRELSIWLASECANRAPDTLDIREIIYSPDGEIVRRWDRLGIRSTGDSSHRYHTHISWFRDAEARDLSKVPLLRRFFEPSSPDPGWTEKIIMELPTLRPGSTGNPVRILQGILIGHGYKLNVDGIYGPETTGAVRMAQRVYQIHDDGITGPDTYAYLLLGRKP